MEDLNIIHYSEICLNTGRSPKINLSYDFTGERFKKSQPKERNPDFFFDPILKNEVPYLLTISHREPL